VRNQRLGEAKNEWTEDEARAALERWRQSGDTIAAFARAQRVSAPRLYWWRRRLAATAAATAPRPEIRLAPATIVSAAAMIEVRGSQGTVTSRASPARSSSGRSLRERWPVGEVDE
jgi:hypothetical protein